MVAAQGVSGLLGALFTPSYKKQLALQVQAQEALKNWQLQQAATTLKPKTPYYQSPYLPALGDTTMRAVMGNLLQRMGPELLAKWGINPTVSTPAAPATATGPAPNLPTGPASANLLLQKYGLA
jgi:hypothetical protein